MLMADARARRAMLQAKCEAEQEPPAARPGRATDQQDGGKKLTDASFVDDLAAYAQAEPTKAIEVASILLTIVATRVMAYGMNLNFLKTKIMISYNGTGPSTAKEAHAKDGLTKVTTPLSDQLVDIVYHQKATGTKNTHSGSMGPEVHHRTTQASRGPLRREYMRMQQHTPRKVL